MAADFLVDYSNDVEILISDSNEPGTCILLEIEVLDEITSEFLNDLSTEMVVDKVATRRNTFTEDGLGKIASFMKNDLIILCCSI